MQSIIPKAQGKHILKLEQQRPPRESMIKYRRRLWWPQLDTRVISKFMPSIVYWRHHYVSHILRPDFDMTQAGDMQLSTQATCFPHSAQCTMPSSEDDDVIAM